MWIRSRKKTSGGGGGGGDITVTGINYDTAYGFMNAMIAAGELSYNSTLTCQTKDGASTVCYSTSTDIANMAQNSMTNISYYASATVSNDLKITNNVASGAECIFYKDGYIVINELQTDMMTNMGAVKARNANGFNIVPVKANEVLNIPTISGRPATTWISYYPRV